MFKIRGGQTLSQNKKALLIISFLFLSLLLTTNGVKNIINVRKRAVDMFQDSSFIIKPIEEKSVILSCNQESGSIIQLAMEEGSLVFSFPTDKIKEEYCGKKLIVSVTASSSLDSVFGFNMRIEESVLSNPETKPTTISTPISILKSDSDYYTINPSQGLIPRRLRRYAFIIDA